MSRGLQTQSAFSIMLKVVQQAVYFIIPLLLCECICAGSVGGYASGTSQAEAGTGMFSPKYRMSQAYKGSCEFFN